MLDKIVNDLKELRREPNSDSANKGIEAHKSIKVNTKGKVLCDEMREKVEQFIMENKPLLIMIAKENAHRYDIPIQYANNNPADWYEDLIAVGIYGVCRGALAWQQKEIEGRELTNFQGELKQAARVRIRHLAEKLNKYWSLIDDRGENL
ncbi:MAG: hypothetical protein IID12_05655 [Candidatus Marinimicrobia bacterium]|nr:hypothetical protein [Candidatus Neomarinimicrobiota bacterium]